MGMNTSLRSVNREHTLASLFCLFMCFQVASNRKTLKQTYESQYFCCSYTVRKVDSSGTKNYYIRALLYRGRCIYKLCNRLYINIMRLELKSKYLRNERSDFVEI